MALPQRQIEALLLEHKRPFPRRRRRFAGVTQTQWALLLLSLAFLAAVRVYVTRQEAAGREAFDSAASLPSIWTESPQGEVRPAALRLSWEVVPEALDYRLSIHTVTGAVVIDQLVLDSTFWAPPSEATPAFPPGDYQWWVEGVDGAGKSIARSGQAAFRIGR
jgi:hypothetical protein